jgi:DDE superfamily endonuclease
VALLSARSPKLTEALRKARKDRLGYLVLDRTLIRTDRVKADRPHFSGKHRVHGMNVQVIASPDGTIIWTSGAIPGKTHDLTAARVWGILRELDRGGILTLADKGHQGADAEMVITPYKGKNKPHQSRPTAPTPSSADPASARTPSSRAGRSSGNYAAAPARPATWSRPSPSFKTTVSPKPPEDEIRSVSLPTRTASSDDSALAVFSSTVSTPTTTKPCRTRSNCGVCTAAITRNIASSSPDNSSTKPSAP